MDQLILDNSLAYYEHPVELIPKHVSIEAMYQIEKVVDLISNHDLTL